MSIPLQRVTSLRRRVQANAPAALCLLTRIWTTAGAETRRVHLARGAGVGAGNASVLKLSFCPHCTSLAGLLVILYFSFVF